MKKDFQKGEVRIIFTALVALVFILLALYVWLQLQKKDPIKIGTIISLTGSAYHLVDVRDGMLLAAEDINSWGGVNGRKIELIIEDSKTDTEEAKKAFARIEKAHHPLLYVSTLSSISMALAPLAKKNEVVLGGLVATTPELIKQNEWTYRYWLTAEDEVPVIIKILEELKVKTLGILYLNDDFGTGFFELLKKGFKKNGGVVKSESFEKKASDLKEKIVKLKDTEAIFAVGFSAHLKAVFKQLREEDFKGFIISQSAATWPPVANSPEADGVYIAAPITYNRNYIFAKEAEKRYMKRYKKAFNHFAANGYDFIKILAGLLEDKEISRGSIKNLLEEGFIYSGVFGDVVLKKGKREINFPLFPARISGGEIKYRYWR